MKIRLACLALAVALAGCGSNPNNGTNDGGGSGGGGGSSGPYVGTWTADVSGWSVTLVIKEVTTAGGTSYLSGTAGTNKPDCFTGGTVEGSVNSSNAATLIATVASNSEAELSIRGQVSGNTLTGTFEAKGSSPACRLSPPVAATFTRK